jgi:hypothetical protein
MVAAMGARYDSDPRVAYVLIGGLGQIISTVLAQTGGDSTTLLALANGAGYLTLNDAFADAVNKITDLYVQAFPTTKLLLSVNFPYQVSFGGNQALQALQTQILARTNSTQIGFMNDLLQGDATQSTLPNRIVRDNHTTHPAGFQYAFVSTDPNCDPTQQPLNYIPELGFRNAGDVGAGLGAKFLEIFEADALNVDPIPFDYAVHWPSGWYDATGAPGGVWQPLSMNPLRDNPNISGYRLRLGVNNIQPDFPKQVITGAASTDVITAPGHGYPNATPIRLRELTGGAGLTVGPQYFTRDVTTNTFKVAASSGGSAIDFTTDITSGLVVKDGSMFYDWSSLTTAISDAFAQKKKLGISISFGVNTPEWMFLNDPVAYSFTLDPSSLFVEGNDFEPLPWDTNFQARALTFIQTFGARYLNESTISYVVLTGFMQGAESRMVTNVDASVLFHDGVTVAGDSNLQSATANFADSDIGLELNGTVIVDGTVISAVIDPQNVTMSNAAKSPSGTNDFYIFERLIGQGDYFKINNIAKSAPPGYTGLSSYPDTIDLPASSAAWLEGSEIITQYFVDNFPNKSLLYTGARPFPGRQSDQNAFTTFGLSNYPRHFGTMSAFLHATCPPHDINLPPFNDYPTGDQTISASNSPSFYVTNCIPVPVPPQPMQDVAEEGISQRDQFIEGYEQDLKAPINQTVLADERIRLLSNVPGTGITYVDDINNFIVEMSSN